MSNPLVIFPYTYVEGINRLEIARLTEGNGLINIVLKYNPPGHFSPSTNANGTYNKDTREFRLKQFFAYSGSQTMTPDNIRRRIEDLEKVLQDKEVIDYLEKIS